MFSRAPRFEAEKDNGLPGPAAYAPASPASKKRGAFLEKEEWWKESKPDTDTFGLYGIVDTDIALPSPGRGRTMSMTQQGDSAKHRLDDLRNHLNAQHSKEMKELEMQLAIGARKNQDLETEKMEYDKIKTDSDIAATRENSLRAEIARAHEQLSLLPSLRQKFDALVKEHAGSKEKHSTTLINIHAQVGDLEKRIKTGQDEVARLSAEGIAKTRELGRLGEEMGRLRIDKGNSENCLREKKMECEQEVRKGEQIQRELRAREETYKELEAISRRQHIQFSQQSSACLSQKVQMEAAVAATFTLESLTSAHQVIRLERKLAEKQDQVAQLVELVLCLEEEKATLDVRAEELESDLSAARTRGQIEEARFDKAQNTHESLLSAERRHMQEFTAMQESKEREFCLEREYLTTLLDEANIKVDQLKFAAGEVDRLHRVKYDLEKELRQTENNVTSAQASLAEKESEIAVQRGEVDKMLTENDLIKHQLASSLSAQKSQEGDLSNERDQRRRLASLLNASQTTETQLQAEIDSLNGELIDYTALQETHEDLLKALDRIMRTADLAEEDANQLAQINAQLVGHNNPSQKIKHLDRLRNELAGLKKKHITTSSELSSANRQIESLQHEIAAYKAIDGVSVKHLQASRAGMANGVGAVRSVLEVSHVGLRERKGNSIKVPLSRDKESLRVIGRMSVSELR